MGSRLACSESKGVRIRRRTYLTDIGAPTVAAGRLAARCRRSAAACHGPIREAHALARRWPPPRGLTGGSPRRATALGRGDDEDYDTLNRAAATLPRSASRFVNVW